MPGNGNRYTDEVKDFARSIYKQSPETNTYEKVALVVSEKFGFPKGKPVPGTIGDWINKGAYSRKAYERTIYSVANISFLPFNPFKFTLTLS